MLKVRQRRAAGSRRGATSLTLLLPFPGTVLLQERRTLRRRGVINLHWWASPVASHG